MTTKTSKSSTLGIRAISGLALLAICVFPLYWGGWAIGVLVAIFGGRALWEWVRMSDSKPSALAYFFPIAGLLVILAMALSGLFDGQWQWVFVSVAITALLSVFERMRRGGALWAGLGSLYIILPCLAIVWLRGDVVGFKSAGFAKLMFVLAVVTAADTWAYLGGSTFKGPKLAPRISPNKTWSGLISGVVFGGLFGALAGWIIGFDPLYGALLALPIVGLAVFGDFFESAIKRILKVKDAGGLLPGHGGLLDRMDSLMFAVVTTALVLFLWPGIWPMPGAV